MICWKPEEPETLRLRVYCLAILFVLLVSPFSAYQAQAKPVIADLSEYRVEIDSAFRGKRMLLFGARNDPGDVVVVVRGPERDVTIRKKKRIAGIWMNAEQVTLKNIPFYYSINGTRPVDMLPESPIYHTLEVGLDHLDFDTEKALPPDVKEEFLNAFREQQRVSGLYRSYAEPMTFMGTTLFKTGIHFPDTLPRGDYSADIYLLEDGLLRGVQSLPIRVVKVGMDAFVYDTAHQYPLLYGLVAVMIAVFSGLLVSHIFKRLV